MKANNEMSTDRAVFDERMAPTLGCLLGYMKVGPSKGETEALPAGDEVRANHTKNGIRKVIAKEGMRSAQQTKYGSAIQNMMSERRLESGMRGIADCAARTTLSGPPVINDERVGDFTFSPGWGARFQ